MTKSTYRTEIDELVNGLISKGADRDQVINALTDCALSFLHKTPDKIERN